MRPLLRAAILFLLTVSAPAVPAWSAPDAASADREIGREDFFVPGLAPVRRAGAYDVTLVYFMDYQCPACRKYTPDVARALKEERRVRVIYRDTPIFGPRSRQAARVAIASQFQGKHAAMHRALMTSDMPLDDAALRAAAEKAGVDWARLQRDLEARGDEIDQLIAWNLQLSEAAGIAGTPAFVIGDTLADGALDYEGLKAEIADARVEAGIATASAEPAVGEAKSSGSEAEAVPEEDKGGGTFAGEVAQVTKPKPPDFEKSADSAATDTPAADESSAGPAFVAWPWIAGLASALAGFFWFARSRFA